MIAHGEFMLVFDAVHSSAAHDALFAILDAACIIVSSWRQSRDSRGSLHCNTFWA